MAFFKANYIFSPSPKVKSFSEATDVEITTILTAARNGDITYQDLVDSGWVVGAERPVHLSAMSATGVGESHAAQDATWIILNGKDFFDLSSGGKNLFVVGLKKSLAETGYMNSSSSNTGGWDSCARRTWCNNVFKNSIPSEELNWFKQFKVKTSNGNRSYSVTTSTDWFSLPSRAEVFGGPDINSTPTTEGITALNYYWDSSHRIKPRVNTGDNGYAWWLRSPHINSSSWFCCVQSDGALNPDGAASNCGLAPFGCF